MVELDWSRCNGCELCVPYCPVGAIVRDGSGRLAIDQHECVECGVCWRSAGCPHGCFIPSPSSWPRSLRALFSDPLGLHKDTRVPGRGTEESKTNDVTGRFRPGQIGLLLELGRPGVGTRFKEVEGVTRLLAGLGVEVHPNNPLRGLMSDPKSGCFLPEVLDEKVLSVVVECVTEEARLGEVLRALEQLSSSLETVCSVGLIRCFAHMDGRPASQRPTQWAARQKLPISANAKVNLGMAIPGRLACQCSSSRQAGQFTSEHPAGEDK